MYLVANGTVRRGVDQHRMSRLSVTVYRSLADARPFLGQLARILDPWTFDIETYDAVESPGRKAVAVDPCHPDFRVRGVAIATSKDSGAWVEFVGDEAAPLRAAFASDAEKGAFNGGFDENGLVYTGWVPQVRNRTRDGMLAMIALGDGTHESLKLSHGIRVLLRRKYHWDEDKGMMRDLPVETVAEGAVRDACCTHELCDLLDGWAAAGKRIEWSRMGQENAEISQAEAGQPEADPWLA
jgi:hypothetical protein